MWVVPVALGVLLGAALGLISIETSLIAMIAAVTILIVAGLVTRPRFAISAGGLVGIGGLWLVTSAISYARCQSAGSDCSTVAPFGAIAAALVMLGLLFAAAMIRARQIP